MSQLASRYIPTARKVTYNPPQAELRRLTAAMPTARLTAYDNYNV